MENETKIEPEKDALLAKLERMLENAPENSRQPLIELVNKRKVELGLLKSELLPAGYKLKKRGARAKPAPQAKAGKQEQKKSKESLRKIAMGVGRITETKEIPSHDIDVKDEPLKKDKKPLEEADSYTY